MPKATAIRLGNLYMENMTEICFNRAMPRCSSHLFRRCLAVVLLLTLWVGGALTLQVSPDATATEPLVTHSLASLDLDVESERDVAIPAVSFPVFLAAGPQEKLEQAEPSFADHTAPPDTPPPELG